MDASPVANARMYSASPSVREDWKTLFAWVLARAELGWPVIDHDPPAPLAALWARRDLGLAMMCGLPFSQRRPRPLLVAAPIPAPPRYGGRAVYFTDMVVRNDSPFERIEDSFGGSVGYTLAESMSGGVAFADYLRRYRRADGSRLYSRAVGNLVNARGVIEALATGSIDIGPVDSYYHDLLRASDPKFAAEVRVLASTDAMPMPPLVATAALSGDELRRLRRALAEVALAPGLAALRHRLLLTGFATPDPADYDGLSTIANSGLRAFEET